MKLLKLDYTPLKVRIYPNKINGLVNITLFSLTPNSFYNVIHI